MDLLKKNYSNNFFSCSILNANPLKCVSMNNQESKIRTQIIDINNKEPLFYPCSIKVNTCCGNFNDINDPYSKWCVHDVFKTMNVKVFNIISRTNETRHIDWHETCKGRCRLNASFCNNKQRFD